MLQVLFVLMHFAIIYQTTGKFARDIAEGIAPFMHQICHHLYPFAKDLKDRYELIGKFECAHAGFVEAVQNPCSHSHACGHGSHSGYDRQHGRICREGSERSSLSRRCHHGLCHTQRLQGSSCFFLYLICGIFISCGARYGLASLAEGGGQLLGMSDDAQYGPVVCSERLMYQMKTFSFFSGHLYSLFHCLP